MELRWAGMGCESVKVVQSSGETSAPAVEAVLDIFCDVHVLGIFARFAAYS